MSVLVFAGSSQFMATELIGSGTSMLIIIITTFFINLRNLLYSASLAPYFQPLSNRWKWLLAYPMADEVYATILMRARQDDLPAKELAWFAAGVSFNLISVWWGSTAVGAVAGDVLPAQTTETLGFISPLIFISLIVPLLVTRPARLTALAATLTSIILAPLPHHLGLLVAAGVGIVAGVWTEKRGSIKQEGGIA
jgi:4-azaleucine resistance transporter AzlC